MTKRTLALRSERLTELTADELAAAVAAVDQATPRCTTTITDTPTVPNVNTCPTLFC